MALPLFLSFAVLFTLTDRLCAATINVPGDQPTIQAGIDAAVSGADEVVVAPGTYNEAGIDLKGKAITVRSASGDPTDTVVDATGLSSNHVVRCDSGEGPSTVLSGFTITGGNADGASGLGDDGGGLLCDGTSPTVENCIFSSNSADARGGGVYCINASPTFVNCLFVGNSANNGGAIANRNAGSPSIINCSFSGNAADSTGGAVHNLDAGILTVSNSIFWGNLPNEIINNNSTPTISYSDVQGGLPVGATDGGGNINADPLFVDAAAGDLRLQGGSPCIDAGDNGVVPGGATTDLDDCPRYVDDPLTADSGNGTAPLVDMGVYEFDDSDGDGVPDCVDLCPGFDDRSDGDGDGIPDGCDTPSVHNLTQGTDYFTITEAITAAINGDEIEADPGSYHEAGISLQGKAITVRSTSGDPSNTIIDGSGLADDNVLLCTSGEDHNTVLSGFTITGGNSTFDGGGGMFCQNTSPTVENCIFSNNSANSRGGAMYNVTGSPIVTNCLFSNNSADVGGGMFNLSSSPTVTNCTFSGNSANDGAGMFNSNQSSAIVSNCVFWANLPSQIDNLFSTPTISFCNVQGGLPASSVDAGGNIDIDPLFVSPPGDLHLQPGSPCIDAADSTPLQAQPVTTDLDGNPRYVNAVIVSDTGAGIPTYLDMGAYETQSDCPLVGDINCDGIVNEVDFALMALHWLETL
jgi:hypothetical protein